MASDSVSEATINNRPTIGIANTGDALEPSSKGTVTPPKPVTGRASNLKNRLYRAELLLEVSRSCAGLETLTEILENILAITAKETSAERATLFLNDPETSELYSRVTSGGLLREIRILNDSGIAGAVFQSGEGIISHDAYADVRFDPTVDVNTGFLTKSLACAPVRTLGGATIGVIQAVNKVEGEFSDDDLDLLDAIASQAALTLQSTQQVERIRRTHQQEMEFLDVVSDMMAEIGLDKLLAKVMGEATRMLRAQRSTVFLNDTKTNELFSRFAQGDGVGEIRLPNHLGIAGAVFSSGQAVNIPHAYADLRFNPAFDKETGFFTRSMLCVPITNKSGMIIGVTQVLNKRGGPFTSEDEQRLKAFTAQVAIALENAKLFDDVQNMKNYSEGMLESMSNAVITLDEDSRIVTCNAAGLRIMGASPVDIIGRTAEEYFLEDSAWIVDKVRDVQESQQPEVIMIPS